MSQLRIEDDGDLAVEGNNFLIVGGREEIRNRLLQNLRTFLGEWFLNNQVGVPYFQIVFEKGAPPNLIEDSLKNVILETVGVSELLSFEPLDLEVGTRELSTNFEVLTEEGETIEIQEILP